MKYRPLRRGDNHMKWLEENSARKVMWFKDLC